MEELFIHILNISITASFLVLAIIFYRIFAKKAPKWISVLLWGLVGLRLLLPFSIESAMSLIPSKNTIPTTIATDRFPSLDTGFESIDEIVNPFISDSMEARPGYSANPVQIRLTVLGWIWIAVTLCMLLYMLASFIYLRIKTRIKLKIDDKAYLCDYVKTPFILGIIKPRIYLPSDISTEYRSHVISHERAHIKRLDHIWKPIGFMLLSVYWFNPLLWIAYVLLCRDIECACDEKVISDLDAQEKATYAEALLSLGIKSKTISACPLAFGETSVKTRVSAVSKYKKPTTVAVVISLAVSVCFAAFFLTYKKNNSVAIDSGIWYAGKVIATNNTDTTCEEVPRFVFTESGDVLVESKNLADLSYVRLGKMNSSYVSLKEYKKLFENVTFREGYDADFLHKYVKSVWRISPTVSSGIDHEEVYLLRASDSLYMAYADSDKIETLYELKFNETLPTYLYTMKFIASDSVNTSLMLYTNNGMGRIIFGDNLNYESLGTYKYENSKLIFKTTDSFELTLVFLDVGNALIYSESESDTKGFDNLLSDGVSFNGYYQLYRAFSATKAFDIDGDGKLEVIYANISSDGTLYYIIHRYKTIQEGTYALKEAYDSLSFEIKNGSLYLICEYSDTDFGLYRYKVDYDGAELTFNMEK